MDKYYKLLHKAKYDGGKPNYSARGFVTMNVPFEQVTDSAEYLLICTPDIVPYNGAIQQDVGKCRELACTMLPEVTRLRTLVDKRLDTEKEKFESLADHWNNIPGHTLKEQIQKEMTHDKVIEQRGYNQALRDVRQMLRDREYELWRCTRLKEETK